MSGGESAGGVAELLAVDHRRLDVVLAEVKRFLAARDTVEARTRFGAFREGLERHIDAEEQEVFPVIEALAGATAGGPTAVMRAEHAELEKLMAEIAAALEAVPQQGLAAPLAALTARIYAHNGKEERILYPMTDRLVREAGTLDDLMGRLRGLIGCP